MVTEFLQCQCGSDEHTLKYTLDPDDGQVWTSVFLNDYRSFWQRLWVALKYLFGYKCKYGHWDCFNMEEADKDRLIALLQKSKECARRANPEGSPGMPLSDSLPLRVAEILRFEECPHGLPYRVVSKEPVRPWGDDATCRPLCDACVIEAVRRVLHTPCDSTSRNGFTPRDTP